MASFVGIGTAGTFGTSATSVVADTPSGVTNGDTIFFVLVVRDSLKASVGYPGAVTQVGSWVTGVTDFLAEIPATGLFRATWDGSTSSYTFTFSNSGSYGGIVTSYGYTGDCTHRQTVTGTDPQNGSSRDSPTLVGTSGNLVFAAMGGSANTTTNTWSGGFTERDDQENYGVNTGADAPSGASVTATLDPGAASTQSMWILVEIGPEAGETFPTTGLLDDFNRADETPLSQSGAWDGPVRSGRSRLRLIGNAAARASSGSTSEDYRSGTSFTESEAYCTVAALPTTTDFALVLARIQSPETAGADFYGMETDRVGANNYSFTAYRVDDGAFVELAVVATGVDLQVGDKFGMEVTGTGATVTLRCLMDTGSGWAQVGSSVADSSGSRITSPGPIGLSIGGITGTLWRLDDFGGGEVARFPAGSLPWFKTT